MSAYTDVNKEPQGCGIYRWTFLGKRLFWYENSPLSSACKVHDIEYDIGFDNYWQLLRADATFATRGLWIAATAVAQAVTFPLLAHGYGIYKLIKGKQHEKN